MKFHLFILYVISTSQVIDLVTAGILECTRSEDCLVDEATCIDDLCECPLGKTFSTDGSLCLDLAIGYESSCEDDAQCVWLLGKHVCNSEKKCVCTDDWRYHNGKCIVAKRLSESCTNNEDCYVSQDIYSMICNDGFCSCNEGYYARGGYDCRPEGLKPGDICALDMDCKFENSYCDRSLCANKGNRRNVSETNVDYLATKKSNTLALETTCNTSQDCEDVPNSICSPLTKTCLCKRGFFHHTSGQCVAELGVDVGCAVDSQCVITPRRCVNGACACPLTRYFGSGLNKCVKVAFSPDFACVTDEWCRILGPDAVCVGDDETYCRCPLNMELNENFICQQISDEEEQECEKGCVITSDCTALQNSICQNGACICPPNYRLEGNVCLPNIGGLCNVNSECLIEHTTCQDSVCSCEENYIPSGELLCVEVVGGIGSPCNSDIQCWTTTENSKCVDEICTCDDGYMLDEGECLQVKLMGEYCVYATQCHVLLGNNVQCRNSICQCSADMEVSPDGLDCRYPNAGPSSRCTSFSFLITLVVSYFVVY